MKAQQKLNLRQTMRRLRLCGATLLLTAWLPGAAQAAPGDLDPSFGNGGIVVTSITNNPYYDAPTSMRVQPDGKIVVSGRVLAPGEYVEYDDAGFFLARYHPSGALDASFGTDGKVISLLGPDYAADEVLGDDIALQPDGKIIAVGYKFNNSQYGFAVNRYNTDGTLDASFGAGGRVSTAIRDSSVYFFSVAVQPDGKIIVVGRSYLGENASDFSVVRYNPSGSLDNGFGTGGVVTTPVGDTASTASGDTPEKVLLQPDGKIVVAGTTVALGGRFGFALVRYNADGSLDPGFGANGIVIHSTPNRGQATYDAALQPDGRIVVAGSGNSGNDTAIIRFNANGSVDTSFASGGIFRTESSFFVGNSIAVQPDGKIVALGYGILDLYQNASGFAVARLNANGSPDGSFGTDGRLITPVNAKGTNIGVAVALQPDGKILALGTSSGDGVSSGDIAIVRYLVGAAPPNPADDPQFFVRQQYLDFLSREPEPGEPWTAILANCPDRFNQDPNSPSAQCDRLTVSAAFFNSPEFRLKGFFVFTFYRVAFDRLADFSEITADMQSVTGQTSADTLARRAAFAGSFVQRQEFRTRFDSLSDAAFIAALLDRYGLQSITTPDPQNPEGGQKVMLTRAELMSRLGGGALTRAAVLRAVVESDEVSAAEFTRAFVAMQYYGYLRRAPEEGGYNAWLNYLNAHPGDFRTMVHGFVNSIEYRRRFGQL